MVHSKMDRISRWGTYGILVHDSKVLLTRKKSGPYKGLWDLPGGAIEFGETPEEALKRELLEESALAINQFEFSNIATAIGKYDDRSVPYEFHHTGLIYKVMSWSERSDLVPEEENRWAMLSSLQTEELTPFASHALVALAPGKGWRPQNSIRGKVIGLAKHKTRLLVCEVLNDEGILKGWCPLGGGIEFGEAAESALKREFLEELGCNVQIIGDPMVWENIFKHHGIQGHEIIFAFPIRFDDAQIYAKNRFQIFEARGSSHWVEWIEIERFKTGEFSLFPPALLEKIDSV
jgi:ADP-ribose pyrophosphatase YjhB (NUDIX family)